MNLKHLEYFVAVAKYGSINKAAQALYISQPHLSHIIKDIEDDVGFELFLRTKQGVVLTTAGARFLKHSNAIMQEMDGLKQIAKKTKRHADTINISMTKFSHTMESFIELCKKHEDLESFSYKLNEGSTIDVIGDIESGVSDVGVIHFASEQSEDLMNLFRKKELTFIPLVNLCPHICISSEHELLKRGEKVTLNALRNYGFVRYIDQYEDFIYHLATESLQFDLNSSPKIVYVLGRSALMHLISSSNFYTIGIQAFDAQSSMYNVVSVPVEGSAELLQFGIILPQHTELTGTLGEFVSIVTRRFKCLAQK
ncbi:MAG: putative LysR family transcriptional regulator [Oscillospiraceae bacterium]|jgi:DNA-binding transcriptional LysR family regulator|nr:putative LysR family transcriptional regulator [Oscillospiraceae bacterium]